MFCSLNIISIANTIILHNIQNFGHPHRVWRQHGELAQLVTQELRQLQDEQEGRTPQAGTSNEVRRSEGSTDIQRDIENFATRAEIHRSWDAIPIPDIEPLPINNEVMEAAAAADPAHDIYVQTFEYGDTPF